MSPNRSRIRVSDGAWRGYIMTNTHKKYKCAWRYATSHSNVSVAKAAPPGIGTSSRYSFMKCLHVWVFFTQLTMSRITCPRGWGWSDMIPGNVVVQFQISRWGLLRGHTDAGCDELGALVHLTLWVAIYMRQQSINHITKWQSTSWQKCLYQQPSWLARKKQGKIARICTLLESGFFYHTEIYWAKGTITESLSILIHTLLVWPKWEISHLVSRWHVHATQLLFSFLYTHYFFVTEHNTLKTYYQ